MLNSKVIGEAFEQYLYFLFNLFIFSPHFVIFPQKSSSDFVKVEYKMIKEVTSSGMGLSPPHQVPSLASAHVSYQWNGPTTTVDVNNCTVTAVDFSAVLHVNGAGPSKTPTLKIFNKLFKCATAVKNGNETVHVLSDSLKFGNLLFLFFLFAML